MDMDLKHLERITHVSKLALKYARSSGMHPHIKCNCTVHVQTLQVLIHGRTDYNCGLCISSVKPLGMITTVLPYDQSSVYIVHQCKINIISSQRIIPNCILFVLYLNTTF
jgi:hypothetical protein